MIIDTTLMLFFVIVYIHNGKNPIIFQGL